MTVNYTTNLSLGQPVTGTESGTWGDDVNNAVTSYLDIAIAGGLAITVTTTDVTLTITQGTSVATNIGSTTAQYAILNVSGAMTAARNLILPSSSRQYVINNACTGGFLLTVKGSATTGVTLVNGEKAHVFWNGSDYAKAANTAGVATFTSITNSGLTATRVVYSTTGGLETDSANLTFDGTHLTLAGGTANGVAYLNGSKVLTTGSAIQFDGTNLGLNTASLGTFNRGIYIDSAGGAYAGLQIKNTAYPNGAYFSISNADLNIANTNTTGNAIFLTNSLERMRIDSSGNVGIGTASPVRKLDVRNTSADYQLHLGDSASTTLGYELGRENTAGLFKFYGNQTGATGYIFSGVDGERMRIDTSGNVGIGTSSPTQKLTVATGSVKVSKAYSYLWDDANVEIRVDDSPAWLAVANTMTFKTYSGAFVFRDSNAGTSIMTVRADTGNVGIGTSSPAFGLSVEKDNGSGYVALFRKSVSDPALTIQTTSSITQIQGLNAALSATNDIAMQLSGGNVGIGTSSPSSLLDLTGNDPTLRFTDNAGSPTATFSIRSTDGTLKFRDVTNSSDRVTIDSSGNVLVTSAAGLGYGTGSGGTVTQATSKSTAVTLNKPTGRITMNNAALGAGASVNFSLNNSVFGDADVCIVNPLSSDSYTVTVYQSYSGVINMRVTNFSAGSLSDALQIKFAIIKGSIT